MMKDLPIAGTNSPATDLDSYLSFEDVAKDVLIGCVSPVLGKEKGSGKGVGFVNPAGFGVAGTYHPPPSRKVLSVRLLRISVRF